LINGSQILFLLPLRLLIALAPISLMQRLHEAGVRWTKGCAGKLFVLMCQWFSPTRMVVTFEGDNLKEEDIVVREPGGRVVKLNLPEKLVLIANHQIYADWWYLWCLTYKSGTHKDVLIVLKNTLKWIPVIGWAMQFFHFIFLARSWASDRLVLSEKLSRLAARAQLRATPLALMIFPEGTLVSKDTRPVSKKYAEKTGIDDMQNTLLPRSTGLHYCLRSLSPQIPDLHMLDVTVAYEGIPPKGYGQSYYTLRSIFIDGIPPPRIHMHLRLYDVRKDVPLGDLSSEVHSPIANRGHNLMPPSPGVPSPSTPGFSPIDPFHPPTGRLSRAEREKDMDPTTKEAALFEQWLRKMWREKDALLDRYLETGTFADRSKVTIRDSGVSVDVATPRGSGEIEVPMELRSKWEILEAFGLFVPVLAWAVCKWTL